MKRVLHKEFVAGMFVMLLIVSLIGSAGASNGKVQKELEYRNIGVTLDGEKLDLKDANGNTVEPFILNGTTYLPARAISSALGCSVSWDSSTSSVVLKNENSSSTSGHLLRLIAYNKNLQDIACQGLLWESAMSGSSSTIVFTTNFNYNNSYSTAKDGISALSTILKSQTDTFAEYLALNPSLDSVSSSHLSKIQSYIDQLPTALNDLSLANDSLLIMSQNRSNMGGSAFQSAYSAYTTYSNNAHSIINSAAGAFSSEFLNCYIDLNNAIQ